MEMRLTLVQLLKVALGVERDPVIGSGKLPGWFPEGIK
jgi:hypothetical protein